ncbi:MAG: hypothetical protein R3F17_08500 [Planctomycetota bacterium]
MSAPSDGKTAGSGILKPLLILLVVAVIAVLIYSLISGDANSPRPYDGFQ